MKKTIKIIRWICVSFFVLLAIVTLSQDGFLGALLMLLGGIIITPLNVIKKLKNKLKINKVITVVLAFALLFAGILASPSSDEPNETQNDNQTASQIVVESALSENSTSDSSKIDYTSKEESVTTSTSNSSSNITSSKIVSSSIKDTISSKNENSSKVESVSKNNTTSKSEVSSKVETTSKPSSVGNGKYVAINLTDIPTYSGKAYVTINNNVPNFSSDELKTTGYETYSNLDNLGRTQMAIASVGTDTMPKDNEERGSISNIKPSGWNQAKYDNISGGWLYNRCHLIGWQLSAENANTKNLITGTKYLNIDGMLPFENMVADYIKETDNHVAYRITPIYQGNNLLVSGIQMEAYSIEDNGDGICFNVYCYNVQPEITINYADGSSTGSKTETTSTNTSSKPSANSNTTSSKEDATSKPVSQKDETNVSNNENSTTYILNTNSKKFHFSSCKHVQKISEKNYAETNESREELINKEYSPCGTCKP